MTFVEHFELWLMAFITLALFSFMYKDNPVYRVVEHVFAGISTGYQIGLVWDTIIIQQVVDPVIAGKYILIIPGLFGVLMLTRLSGKYSWVSRLSLAFVMGVTAGVFLISQLHGTILPHLQATMFALDGSAGFQSTLLSIIVIVGVVSTLIYFYYSKEHKGAVGVTAKVGIWFIMTAFGAHFGFTVMGRVSLLIGRVQFLIEDWIGAYV